MGRILVLLLFAGLAGIFVVIYNAGIPVQSAAPTNSNATAEEKKRAIKDSRAEKQGKALSSRKAAGKRPIGGSQPSAGPDEPPVPATDSTGKPTNPNADPLLTVNSDSTPVYTANSKSSKVIRVLKRGERVRPDVEVLDSNGRWRVVRGQQKEKPGFVLEDQIRTSADQASKSKTPGD